MDPGLPLDFWFLLSIPLVCFGAPCITALLIDALRRSQAWCQIAHRRRWVIESRDFARPVTTIVAVETVHCPLCDRSFERFIDSKLGPV